MTLKEQYENLLRTMCENYDTMLQLIKKIAEYDIIIFNKSDSNRENTNIVLSAISQKERYVEQFTDISLKNEKEHLQLDNIISVCLEVESNPLYYLMCDMHILVSQRLNLLLECEDGTSDKVIENLEKCMESYKLDIELSKVSNKKRSTFLLIPNKY